ncbi:MAG: SoxXA-binding protein [Chromatiales bacterium]|nr:SoxXA-binding protein [Gammaproteobacteria bacterium]MCP5353385.1 SoxXA-binding protein [Chromatiales bacterium]
MKQRSLMQVVLLGGALSLAALSGVSCASNDAKPAAGAGNAAYDAAVAAASAEIKKAGATGFEWRDTGKFMKDAEEAVKAGDMDKAMKLVAKAESQAKLAQQQAVDQANPDFHF